MKQVKPGFVPDFVSFTLKDDPNTYNLIRDFNHFCDVEAETGINLMRAVSTGQVSARETRALLYACLKTGHPEVLISDAGELLSRPDWGVALTALMEALQGSEVEPEPLPVEEPEAPKE